MSYKIVNQRGVPLDGFFSNGGWEIRDVFAFSSRSWISFETEKAAQQYLLSMRPELIRQADRWGNWLEVALKFWKTLKVSE